MSDQKTAEAVARALASQTLDQRVTTAIFRPDNDGTNPTERMEAEILSFFGFSTGGRPLTNAGLDPWKVAAVLQVMAHYQSKYADHFGRYFGHAIDGPGLVAAAQDLPTEKEKSFLQFLAARIPAEARATWTGWSKTQRNITLAAALVAAALIIREIRR